MEYYSATKKELKLDTCYNINEHRKYYSEQNKPGTKNKKQILHNSTYMKYLEYSNS